MSTDIRAYPRHLRVNGYCLSPGGRTWFQLHGLDWREFARDGIAVEVLEQFDDFFAKTVVATARREAEQNGGNQGL